MFIKIEKNPDGSHAYQVGGYLENGWAVIPSEMILPTSFPYVDIEVDENNIVVSMTEGEETLIEEPDIPSQLDIIEAQVTYTALMTDTLLEV